CSLAACKPLQAMCGVNSDCCTYTCSGGTCQPIPGSTMAGACTTLGNACTANAGCCSGNCQGGRCAESGGACASLGDICFKATDCCGGPVGGPGSGNITCVLDNTVMPAVGRCRNPVGCNPEGDVCGGTGDGGVNARQDCCDCASPKFQCCKADNNGVNRCYG